MSQSFVMLLQKKSLEIRLCILLFFSRPVFLDPFLCPFSYPVPIFFWGEKKAYFFHFFNILLSQVIEWKKSKHIRGDTKSGIDDISQQEVDSKT